MTMDSGLSFGGEFDRHHRIHPREYTGRPWPASRWPLPGPGEIAVTAAKIDEQEVASQGGYLRSERAGLILAGQS